MRHRPSYYEVIALKDGTVLAALQHRKPQKRSLWKGEKIDADGIYRWHITETRSAHELKEHQLITQMLAVAGRLNTRLSLRELVLPKLDDLEQKVGVLTSKLERIEQKLDRLASAQQVD